MWGRWGRLGRRAGCSSSSGLPASTAAACPDIAHACPATSVPPGTAGTPPAGPPPSSSSPTPRSSCAWWVLCRPPCPPCFHLRSAIGDVLLLAQRVASHSPSSQQLPAASCPAFPPACLPAPQVGHMSWGQRFEVVNYQAYDIGEPAACGVCVAGWPANHLPRKMRATCCGGMLGSNRLHALLPVHTPTHTPPPPATQAQQPRNPLCTRSAWRHAVWPGPAAERVHQRAVRQPALAVPRPPGRPAAHCRVPGRCQRCFVGGPPGARPVAGRQQAGQPLLPAAAPSHPVNPCTAPCTALYCCTVVLQWYDTRTMTIIKDATFANYKWQPQLGFHRMSVFYVSEAPLHSCAAICTAIPLRWWRYLRLTLWPRLCCCCRGRSASGATGAHRCAPPLLRRSCVPLPAEHDAQRRVQAHGELLAGRGCTPPARRLSMGAGRSPAPVCVPAGTPPPPCRLRLPWACRA